MCGTPTGGSVAPGRRSPDLALLPSVGLGKHLAYLPLDYAARIGQVPDRHKSPPLVRVKIGYAFFCQLARFRICQASIPGRVPCGILRTGSKRRHTRPQKNGEARPGATLPHLPMRRHMPTL